MPSDRARVTYDATRNWRGLIAQQGRVTVEADWNEATEIDLERDRRLTLDFVGPVGTPSTPSPGYVVSAVPQTGAAPGAIPGDLTIGSGTIYVGGERLELAAPVTYSTQPEWLDSSTNPLWVPPGVQAANVTELVYLLAFEQEVSAVEDSALSDVALGGPDTMQRLRIIQHFVRQTITVISPEPVPPIPVGPIPVHPPVTAGVILPHLPIFHLVTQPVWWRELINAAPSGSFAGVTLDANAMRLVSTAALQVSYQASSGSNGNGVAELAGGNGYLGAENQLIRVMVASTAGGAAPYLVWGFDNASSLYRVQAESGASGNQVILTLDTSPIDSYHYPVAGQAVELLRDEVWLSGQDYIASPTGFVSTVVTGYDPTTRTVVIGATGVDGSALPNDYLPPVSATVEPAPVIGALSPSTGPITGGTLVVVTGSGFTGAQTVEFGVVPGANLLVQGDGRLTVNAPGVQTAGPVSVTVTTPLGTSNTATFTYATPGTAAVTSVAPASGVLYGGTLVTIAGSGFTGASEVLFGGNAGLGLTVTSDTSLTVFTPPGPAGEVQVTVITPQGNANNSEQQFTYAADPPAQVTGVSPASGGLAGGTIVTVSGSAFTGATAVDFGAGNPGTGLSVLSDTELTVVSPPAPSGSGGTVQVTLTTPAGPSTGGSGDAFTYQLEVTGISPAVGPPTGGTIVTVTGAGFTGATSVTFGGVAGTALAVQSDTQLTVTTPPGGGTVAVVVAAAGGSSPQSAAASFSYEKTPQLYLRVWQSLAAPAQGSGAPAASSGPYSYDLDGTGVTVSLVSAIGQFHAGDFWRFAVRPLDPLAVYPGRYLIAPQPPEGPRTWICPLAVLTWNADGTAGAASSVPVFWNLVTMTNAIQSNVKLPLPVVNTVSPNSGAPSGGTVVTLTGADFTGATTVYFGPTTGTGLSVQSDTQLTVTSPAGTGIVDVRVITAGGESATGTSDQFAYMGVTAVSPAVGPPVGGTPVTVTGSGFTGATAVHFGGVAGTNLTVVSDTEITVTSPAGSGLVDVTVVNGTHTSPAVVADRFAYVSVTSVSPNVGPESGGQQVTLGGVGFSLAAVTAVDFGIFGTSSLQVVSDTTISVTTPPGSGGPQVSVVTQLGSTAASGVAAPVYTYQGKNAIKDHKDLGDHKSAILDKTHEKLAEKITEKISEKIPEKVTDGHPILPQVVERSAEAKEAEAKPPETAGSAGPSLAGGASVNAAGEGEAEQGHAFIAQDERPEVGNGVVADDAPAEHE
jgi:uncharacterized protein DUF6519/IPT/TIG domain-containing protein